MSSRVQSPNVGKALEDYLDVGVPPSLQVAPFLMPVVNFPFFEYWMFGYYSAPLSSDTTVTVVRVPKDEDWLLSVLHVSVTSGNSNFDWIQLKYPLKRIYDYGTIGVTPVGVYLDKTANAETFDHVFGNPVPMCPESYIEISCDHVSGVYYLSVTGIFLRRKW